MRYRRWGWAFLLAALLAAAMGPIPAGLAQGRPSVLDVRLGLHPDKTRVVLDLTGVLKL